MHFDAAGIIWLFLGMLLRPVLGELVRAFHFLFDVVATPS